MAGRHSLLFMGLGATLLAAAAPAPRATPVARDLQAAMEQEAYAVMLHKELAEHARHDGSAALAALFDDAIARNERSFEGHRAMTGVDTLHAGLQAAVGAAIRRHQLYATAAIHARAVGDAEAARSFDTLAREAAQDRDTFGTALRERQLSEDCMGEKCR